jgi:CHAD domain-containing protein
MRVASRRLRAAMDAYEAAYQPKPFKQTYKQVKKNADLLGTVRDTDVMKQNVEEHIKHANDEGKAGLQWFIERLATYRKQEQQELEKFLQNINKSDFEQRVDACIAPGGGTNG